MAESVENLPKNTILYGPPGTGKTYKTIDMALKTIDGKVPEERTSAKERFDLLTKEGRIAFVTFHQSYGYEEFVEGIKAETVEDLESQVKAVTYEVRPGVFKRLTEFPV